MVSFLPAPECSQWSLEAGDEGWAGGCCAGGADPALFTPASRQELRIAPKLRENRWGSAYSLGQMGRRAVAKGGAPAFEDVLSVVGPTQWAEEAGLSWCPHSTIYILAVTFGSGTQGGIEGLAKAFRLVSPEEMGLSCCRADERREPESLQAAGCRVLGLRESEGSLWCVLPRSRSVSLSPGQGLPVAGAGGVHVGGREWPEPRPAGWASELLGTVRKPQVKIEDGTKREPVATVLGFPLWR